MAIYWTMYDIECTPYQIFLSLRQNTILDFLPIDIIYCDDKCFYLFLSNDILSIDLIYSSLSFVHFASTSTSNACPQSSSRKRGNLSRQKQGTKTQKKVIENIKYLAVRCILVYFSTNFSTYEYSKM